MLIVATLCVAIGAQAQSTALTGKVLDGNSENALIGTTVLVKGTTNGVVADATGAFSIQVPSFPTELVFSFIGYETQTVTAVNAQPLTIR
ncbi:MAG: carboxypeptidase-like regulatory domain-containing protein, partial [Flavobacteriales bacterium]|nr:carboxypeptidase-like regulatory domain-containing protein [Flavobacteriales bacterium]